MWDEVVKRGERFLELKRQIEDPAAAAHPQYPARLREYGRLARFGAIYQRFLEADKERREANEILADATADADLKRLAEDELPGAEAEAEEAREELLEVIEQEDEDAARNAIIEVYAGVGGDEAAIFAGDLFDMYKRFCDRRGFKLTVTDSSPGEHGGFKEICFRVEGEGAFGVFLWEGGGHRVQRVPETEAQGRIHTSMARVAVLPEAEEVDLQVDPKDVKESFCAAGGPGGQNVNKVATQCQLTHIPTGIIVHCIETRSQAQNRARAWQILRSKLYALRKAEADRARGDQRLGQLGSGDRSERIRTYNFPQGRCTDHRLEGDDKNWPVTEIVEGRLDDLHAKLKQAAKSARRSQSAKS